MPKVSASALERHMLNLINAERAKANLEPLQLEQHLNSAAETHSQWIERTINFSHTGQGGSDQKDRALDAGFGQGGNPYVLENLSFTSADRDGSYRDEVAWMVSTWMQSDGHRANILSERVDYTGIGIEFGEATIAGVTYTVLVATQVFGATDDAFALDWTDVGTDRGDRMTGGSDVDLIRGAGGNDTISGGAGQDVLKGQGGNDRLSGGGGGDELHGGAGRDTLLGGGGQDLAMGGGGNDTIRGGQGGDVARGGAGADKLFGQAGADKLFGQGGSDRLDGGGGRDLLSGGAGRDTFVFRKGGGVDKITDFNVAEDRLELDATLWDDSFGRAQAVATFAEVTDKGVLFDFGSHELLLKGLDSTDGLESRIDLI